MNPRARTCVCVACLLVGVWSAGCQRRIVGVRGFGGDAAITAPGARAPKKYATTEHKPRKERPVLKNVRRTPSPLGASGGYGSGLSAEIESPDGAAKSPK